MEIMNENGIIIFTDDEIIKYNPPRSNFSDENIMFKFLSNVEDENGEKLLEGIVGWY